jgi:hypothetical protein
MPNGLSRFIEVIAVDFLNAIRMLFGYTNTVLDHHMA